MVKMLVLVGILAVLLGGCGQAETFETVGDWYALPVLGPAKEICLDLPAGASVLTMDNEAGGILYFCGSYTMTAQALPGGDLTRTVKTVTGFDREGISLVETQPQNRTRYDFVWAAAGETGSQVCRGAILDDGERHYVLTVMAEAAEAQELEAEWDRVFSSFWVA